MARKHSAIAQLNQFSPPYIEWLRLHEDPPPTLYHYTTADALIPILQSGHLWATNSRFMNDPTELSYAILLLRQVLEEEESKD